jgi:putative ABC transport system ATP-binding protein
MKAKRPVQVLKSFDSSEQSLHEHGVPMVVAKNLCKLYEGGDELRVEAIKGVSLTIDAGEFVAVVGPSGSGKSTLLNLLAAIDNPTSGIVEIDGVDIASMNGGRLADFRRDNIGLVFQLFNLIPTLSALDNVKLPLIPYAQRGVDLDKRARKLLHDVGLSNRAHHLPSQLSGGEQQRVAIARALINQPQLLLADEPTGNLDSGSGTELMELFSCFHDEYGVTIVMVTHDMAMASYAQRIIRLHDGSLIEEDNAKSAVVP